MLITVAISWLIFFFLRYLRAPAHFKEVQEAELEKIKATLVAVSQERPLSYSHTDFNLTPPRHRHTDLTPKIYFTNTGDKLIRWHMENIAIEVNGAKSPQQLPSQQYLINKGQKGWYELPTFKNAPFNGWPLVIDLSYDLVYDNVPPISKRISRRKTRFTIPSAKSTNIPATDLLSDEL